MVSECEERRTLELILRVARFKALMLFDAFYSTDGHMGRLWFYADTDRKKKKTRRLCSFLICSLTGADSESVSSVFRHWLLIHLGFFCPHVVLHVLHTSFVPPSLKYSI